MSVVRLDLSERELQTVIESLEARPYRDVAPVVLQIRAQIDQHNQRLVQRAQQRAAKAAPSAAPVASAAPDA